MDRSTRYTDKFFRGYVCGVVQVQSVPTGLDCHLPTRCGSRQSSDQVIERECIHCYPQRELKVLMYVLLLSFSRPYLIADVYPFSPLNGCEAAGGDMPHPVRPAWRTAALNTKYYMHIGLVRFCPVLLDARRLIGRCIFSYQTRRLGTAQSGF